MKRPAWRITIGTAVLVFALVGVLVVSHWDTVREHVEAWRFQLTRKTETMTRQSTPPRSRYGNLCAPDLFWSIAEDSSLPVIFDPIETKKKSTEVIWTGRSLESAEVLQLLDEEGYRVLDQRFPFRAYVVTGYPQREASYYIEAPQRVYGASTTIELKASPLTPRAHRPEAR